MKIALLIPLLGSIAGAVYLVRRRPRNRGPLGDPSFLAASLLIAWFAGLQVGQFTSSLTAMTWIAAISLASFAALLRVWTPDEDTTSPVHDRWSPLDWFAFAFLSFALLKINGNDNLGHYSIVATYLRGNIPPSALNDPSLPLAYHFLFDAGAAAVSAALGIEPELALDVVSIACVAAVIEALRGLSRFFYRNPLAQQCSRLFFLFGLGPTYLRGASPDRWDITHGTSTQSFAGAIFRRPVALNFVIFVLLLGLLLPHLVRESSPGKKNVDGPPPLLLIPIAFILPTTSEELCLFATGAVLLLVAFRKIPTWGGVAWLIGLALSLPLSGSFHMFLHPVSHVGYPIVRPRFTPILPSWSHAWGGLALFSVGGAKTVFYEWGPIFAMALWWHFQDSHWQG